MHSFARCAFDDKRGYFREIFFLVRHNPPVDIRILAKRFPHCITLSQVTRTVVYALTATRFLSIQVRTIPIGINANPPATIAIIV